MMRNFEADANKFLSLLPSGILQPKRFDDNNEIYFQWKTDNFNLTVLINGDNTISFTANTLSPDLHFSGDNILIKDSFRIIQTFYHHLVDDSLKCDLCSIELGEDFYHFSGNVNGKFSNHIHVCFDCFTLNKLQGKLLNVHSTF